MKVVTLLVSALAFAAAPAGAYLGEVVASFPAPTRFPIALAASPEHVFVFSSYWGVDKVYTLDPNTGSVIRSYGPPLGHDTSGLGYEAGGYLWTVRMTLSIYGTAWVARCEASTGSIYSSWPISARSIHLARGGLTCEGRPDQPGSLKAVVVHDLGTRALVSRHATNGSLLSMFYYSNKRSYRDSAWDYGNGLIWFTDNDTPGHIYGHRANGSFLTSFRAPSTQPRGSAYFNGYLWVCTFSPEPTHLIWKVHCPPDVAVKPASVGRVKALFR